MKKKKPQHRIPWWCFDIPYEKPPTKGWWKKFYRRVERVYWKKYLKKEDYKND